MQPMLRQVPFQHPSDYTHLKVCGCGAYGLVCEAVWCPPGAPARHVAIKRVGDVALTSTDQMVSESFRTGFLKKICREVEILLFFNGCPQVIELLDAWVSDNNRDLYLVMPYVSHTLLDMVRTTVQTEEALKWISFQAVLGLDVIHRCHVIHRDLALANLFLEQSTSDLFLADFGLSRARHETDEAATLDVVTLPYRAPELLLQYPRYDSRADLWSIGMVLVELMTGGPFIHTKDILSQLDGIYRNISGFPGLDLIQTMGGPSAHLYYAKVFAKGTVIPATPERHFSERFRDPVTGAMRYSPNAIDFLQRCLTFDARPGTSMATHGARPFAPELINHPWFSHPDETGQDYYVPYRQKHLEEPRWRQPLISEVESLSDVPTLLQWLIGATNAAKERLVGPAPRQCVVTVVDTTTAPRFV